MGVEPVATPPSVVGDLEGLLKRSGRGTNLSVDIVGETTIRDVSKGQCGASNEVDTGAQTVALQTLDKVPEAVDQVGSAKTVSTLRHF
ncbi:hypothetical protein E3T34_01185 [Cryobacterium sp. TMT1-62]|uniref:hypothetical protein n=1 Tax=unclassified Cryobacterium TaxID=2649013 RepID=UPI000CE533AE|nr:MULTISPECIES: hypothetical protein [unclassified Cryobacterium]TFB54237.1 hypothetical protein E3N94_12885 [Cryobacterium sp. Sr3]TFC67775.1 hypothetical protein E3O54_08120 [Cryobacterium sp. TMT2-4]TFD36313.1 hypothetical protein E3T34_01185 [Cryobacterium sp. TMT1-62]TFD37753.1 hypothetical protein E3T40_03935 [Cryobacterium sp. TMT1-19]